MLPSAASIWRKNCATRPVRKWNPCGAPSLAGEGRSTFADIENWTLVIPSEARDDNLPALPSERLRRKTFRSVAASDGARPSPERLAPEQAGVVPESRAGPAGP